MDRAHEGVHIRNMSMDDVAAVTAIDEKITGKHRPNFWRKKLQIYGSDPEACVAAEVNGRLVGFMLGHVKGSEFGLVDETAWVEILEVDPEYQGMHFGQLLAQTLFDSFRRRGVKNVYTLCNWKDGRMLAFFSSLGFQRGDFIHLEVKL